MSLHCNVKIGQDRPILPAQVANHNADFTFSFPLSGQALKGDNVVKAGIRPLLSEILRGLKKENYFWNTAKQLTPTQKHPRFSGDCFDVHLLIFNFKF